MYKLNLKEIPQEGRSYQFTRASGELNSELRDLIGESDYEINFHIRPMGNIYELRGSLKTGVEQLCAKCGWDLTLPMSKSFTEYLIADGDHPRGSRQAHGNQSLDLEIEGTDYTTYQGEHFAVGEHFHELIALNEDLYPSCGLSDCEHLKEAQQIMESIQASQASEVVEEPKNPFAALKGLRIPKQ